MSLAFLYALVKELLKCNNFSHKNECWVTKNQIFIAIDERYAILNFIEFIVTILYITKVSILHFHLIKDFPLNLYRLLFYRR